MAVAKIQFLIGIALLFGSSSVMTSCKSFERAFKDAPDYGGKEPVTEQRSRPTRSSSSSRPESSRSVSSRQKLTPAETPEEEIVPRLEEQVIPEDFKINDEKILMEDMPPPPKPEKKEAVPGVEGLINRDDTVKISEDSPNRIIDAGGKDVEITGNDGVIVISGGCGKLTLKGRNNQVQCDTVKKIEITGDENTLILGSMGGGVIRGSGNDLSWGSGFDGLSPIVESFGEDNTMMRLE
ncbi:MAG: DUF3060 domain-containing protein [Verrucomicrobiales bacterium]|nr:DUF3060 domain-containing protein [Verrucomicrobiales bacterium]